MTALDAVALTVGLRPLLRRAHDRHLSARRMLWRGTDPAVTTVILTSAAGLLGAVVAAAGRAVTQVTGRPVADAVASAVIGIVLLATPVVLLHTNRELLTGKGLPTGETALTQAVVLGQPGVVVAVPDLFAMVVGPATVIVDAAEALRRAWPSVAYVYLNPVASARARRHRARGPGEHPGVATPAPQRTAGTAPTLEEPSS